MATGEAPLGRLYAGDLNAIQDHYADLTNFTQTVAVGTLQVGDTTIMLVKYGTGEMRITSSLRTDGILRGLGGLLTGTFTTAQRDLIPAGLRPYGMIILNTSTNSFQWNSGTDPAPVWAEVTGNLANLPTTNEKAALAGTGTPSGSNRYVTSDTLTAALGGALGAGSAAGGDLGDTYPNPTVRKASKAFALAGDTTPATISVDQNDYNPTGLVDTSTLRLAASAARTITGLAGGSDGRLMIVHNVGAFPITFSNESSASTAVNRFAMPSSADYIVNPNEIVLVQYDGIANRWKQLSRTAPASFVGAAIYSTADQNVASHATVIITFGGEDLDTSGFHTAGANRITIPAGLDGIYEIDAFGAFQNGDIITYLRKNGTVSLISGGDGHTDGTPPGLPRLASIAHVPFVNLVSADFIEMVVFNGSSSTAGTAKGRVAPHPASGCQLTIRKIG